MDFLSEIQKLLEEIRIMRDEDLTTIENLASRITKAAPLKGGDYGLEIVGYMNNILSAAKSKSIDIYNPGTLFKYHGDELYDPDENWYLDKQAALKIINTYIPRHFLPSLQADKEADTVAEKETEKEAEKEIEEKGDATSWTINTPQRFDALADMIVAVLKEAKKANLRCPTPREIIDLCKEKFPNEVTETTFDGIKYYGSKGNIRATTIDAVEDRISRLVNKRHPAR